MRIRVVEKINLTNSEYEVISNSNNIKVKRFDYLDWDKKTIARQIYEGRKRRDGSYEKLKHYKELCSHILTDEEAEKFHF